MGTIYKYTNLFSFLAGVVFLFSSCNKTELDYGKQPYNTIQSFKIAGYASLDSIEAVIADGNIQLYWNSTIEKPERIKPNIIVPKTASISPASGEEVDFSENTVYTVTAEDGTTREYKLKPVLAQVVPVITYLSTQANNISYNNINHLRVYGEYFLTSGDPSTFKFFARRVHDGFEFELPITDRIIPISATVFQFDFPLTLESDTGFHQLWVQEGEARSNEVTRWVGMPRLRVPDNVIYSLEEDGQDVHPGDVLTLNWDIQGAHRKFFKGAAKNIAVFMYDPVLNRTVSQTNIEFVEENDQIKITLPESFSAYEGHYITRIDVWVSFFQTRSDYNQPPYDQGGWHRATLQTTSTFIRNR
mgnify:CR=1 FL=1